jgi:hypothetical protein
MAIINNIFDFKNHLNKYKTSTYNILKVYPKIRIKTRNEHNILAKQSDNSLLIFSYCNKNKLTIVHQTGKSLMLLEMVIKQYSLKWSLNTISLK